MALKLDKAVPVYLGTHSKYEQQRSILSGISGCAFCQPPLVGILFLTKQPHGILAISEPKSLTVVASQLAEPLLLERRGIGTRCRCGLLKGRDSGVDLLLGGLQGLDHLLVNLLGAATDGR